MTATAYERVAQRLADTTGYPPRRSMARCPAHDDSRSSLSVSTSGGKVLLHCHAGCDIDDVLKALNLTTADLFDEPGERPHVNGTPAVIAEYPYIDEHGKLLYVVERRAGKQFRQRRPDGNGGWLWRLDDTRRVLYRLPKVLATANAGGTVYVVEGEKDVHAAENAGAVATCNSGGAGKWQPEYAAALTGAHVVVVTDQDEPGRAHAQQVADSVRPVAASVIIVEPTSGKDLSDHLTAGHTLDQLVTPTTTGPDPALVFRTVAELAAHVAAQGPRRWLLRGIWPAGSYGVLAAEMKAQKTVTTADLAVSVASGQPWLGHIPIDDPGPVIMFIGEGGEANTLRQLRAAAEARGVTLEQLPIHVCCRAPHLNDPAHVHELTTKINQERPRLVTLDPLYLSAHGANLADLYAMGALLETVQHVCNATSTALWVVTHFNRKLGTGISRILGAGPAEWGRVLISASVVSRHTNPDTRATDVVSELDIIGGEIPDTTLRIRRRMWTDNPDDLDSPLHVTIQIEEPPNETADTIPGKIPGTEIGPAGTKLLEALQAQEEPAPQSQLVDWIAAKYGHGLRRETVSKELNKLARMGLVDSLDGADRAGTKLWLTTKIDGVTECDITCDITPPASVDGCDRPTVGVSYDTPPEGHTVAHPHHTRSPDQPSDHTVTPTCATCGWPLDSEGHILNCEESQ